MKHICQECGKEFITKKSTSKYCSRECCDKALAKQKRANKPEYHCEVCGAKVEIRGKPRGEHIYCSKKCYGVALAEKNKLKRRRICVVCGKEFDPILLPDGKYSEATTCSEECRLKLSEQTCMAKFGVKNASQNEEIKAKKEETRQQTLANRPEKPRVVEIKHCEECGKEFKWFNGQDNYYENGQWISSERFCCHKCGMDNKYKKAAETYAVKSDEEKKRLANMTKDYFANRTEEEKAVTDAKRAKTMLKRYGVECSLYIDPEGNKRKVRERWKNDKHKIIKLIKERNLERYGVEWTTQLDSMKEKEKATNLERYGVEWASQSEEIQDRVKKTSMERYGYERPMMAPEIKEKAIQSLLNRSDEEKEESNRKRENTCLEKYGVKSVLSCKEIKDKIKKTNIERYGSPYSFDYEKIEQTNLKKYGVRWTILLDKARKNSGAISKPNRDFAKRLELRNLTCEMEKHLCSYSYDIYTRDILIEIDPTYTHFSTVNYDNGRHFKPKDPHYHQDKTFCAWDNDYRCVHVWDWDDKDKIVDLILPRTPVEARTLKLKEVSIEETNVFLNMFHLNNSCDGQTVRLGLYDNDGLVQIMTLGVAKHDVDAEWEILRLCTRTGVKVIDGANLLFDYFVREFNPSSVVARCDNSKFTGKTYGDLGMSLRTLGEPRKHWFNLLTGEHLTNVEDESGLIEAGALEIYDSGESIYFWTKN